MIVLFTKLLSAYIVDYPKVLTYMMQQSEYRIIPFMSWWARQKSFRSVMNRGQYIRTTNSVTIRVLISIGALTYWLLNLLTIRYIFYPSYWGVAVGVVALVLYPLYVVVFTIITVLLLSFVRYPFAMRRLSRAKATIARHDGIVIAVAGSFGKTSMKDLLNHLIDGSFRYAVTKGNQNTLTSHVRFIESLKGDEEVLVVELGEGAPDDIKKMVELLKPDYAVLTGIAPNHLDQYKTLDRLSADFAYLADFVGPERTYLNADSSDLMRLLGDKGQKYSTDGFGQWKVKKAHIGIQYVSFELGYAKEKIDVRASLLGKHSIGPLVFAIVIALELGVSKKMLLQRISALRPYEHRMQPRDLGGMWMIDDTYNGNIEGMLAGLRYLQTIDVAGRKLYATPGLVDQGEQTTKVHEDLGTAIAGANPDEVYLMKNSVSSIVQDAMTHAGYKGRVTVVENPLGFYTNIKDILAKGDLILCQNDWPDNYS